jgi:hypothetical protein
MMSLEKTFYWLPRLIGLGFVIYLSIFSLDVFSEYSGLQVILPLLIHLIPSFVLLGVILLAWKYDLVGAVVFIGFAILYFWDVGLTRPWSWYAGIVAPAAIVGTLFLISWFFKRNRKQSISEQPGSNQ